MNTLQRILPLQLLAIALVLAVLPAILGVLGLTTTSATEVVVFAIACMALNIIVGHTGLVSFGHGAWFGLSAYIAALVQLRMAPGSFAVPVLAGLVSVAVLSTLLGALILRRRGVYFSLLTLAFAAMVYTVAFRWTDVTGGENGIGGISRPALAGTTASMVACCSSSSVPSQPAISWRQPAQAAPSNASRSSRLPC